MFRHAKPKKLLSLLLSAGMIFSAMAATVTASAEGEPAPMSLLPLEEDSMDVYLDGYTDEQLKAVPLSAILSQLMYRYDKDPDEEKGTLGHSAGDPVTVGENDVIVMGDTDGGYRFMDRSDTVDLFDPYSGSSDSYTRSLELIVGSGKQLDKENERFNITVHITQKYRSDVILWVYTFENGVRKDLASSSLEQNSSSVFLSPSLTWTTLSSLRKDGNLYIEATGILVERSSGTAVETQFSADFENSEKTEYGYRLNSLSDRFNYTCSIGGSTVSSGEYPVYIDSKSLNVSCSIKRDSGSNIYSSSVAAESDWFSQTFHVNDDPSSPPPSYSFRVDSRWISLEKDGNVNGYIEKVVSGQYDSAEEAANAEDVTEQVFNGTYPIDYSSYDTGVDFTLLYREYEYDMENHTYIISTEVKSIVLHISLYNPYLDPDGSTPLSAPIDRPTVGIPDPYFRIRSVYALSEDGKENWVRSISISDKNSDGKQDSYYGFGYQTWFIDNTSNTSLSSVPVDPSKLKLSVYTDENFNVYDATKSYLINFDEPQDFTGEKVQYIVSNKNDTLNRFVSIVVKSENGPRLYVCGPEKREIYFDDYYGQYHDILIANPGNGNLTGLNVEWAVAPRNVKIDDYWMVGGARNDTLEPISFSGSYSYENNFAKIRLVPDGDGEISGTLKISADGQTPYFIELSGHAGDPKIVTESPLPDAVKYVPYNAIIATDRIHEWQKITFVEASGRPAGLSMNEKTGEIYGVPQEAGTYSFTVRAKVTYPSSGGSETWFYIEKEFELTVLENTDINVYEASDEGYTIVTPIGTEGTSGARDYRVKSDQLGATQLFVSNGTFGDFIDLWLNGEKLNRGVDYTVESGSTRITIRSQTFADLVKEESNTLAAEFRVDGDLSKDLKRTSQNFIITDLDVPENPSNPTSPANPSAPSAPSGSSNASPAQNNSGQNGVKDPVQETIDLIKAIPSDPTADPDAVDAARKAYDALTDEQKKRVDNYRDLLDAEETLKNADDAEEENNDINDAETDGAPDDAESDSGEDSDIDGESAPDGVTMYGVVIDLNGTALSGLEMELHSDVQSAVTSRNGSYRFETAEFGAHTLILTDPKTGASTEKKFTLVEADTIAIEDDVIYAPNRASLSLSIAFDGRNVLFLQANDPRLVEHDSNVPTGVPLSAGGAIGALIAAGAVLAALPKRKKRG